MTRASRLLGSRWLAALLFVRVVLVVLGVFQISSVGHLVADAAAIVMGAQSPPHDDDDDSGPCDCPLGCPTCHAPHGTASLPPTPVTLDAVVYGPARMPRPDAAESAIPRSDPRSLYRPPRQAG
jgi:hypothetical protein